MDKVTLLVEREALIRERDRLAARVQELEGMERRARTYDAANAKLVAANRRLRRALELIRSQAGIPDAADACRTILDTVSNALAHISQNAPETDIPPGRVAPGDMPDLRDARISEPEREWKATREHRFYEMEHGRADRLAAPDPTAGEAEHAALLRVAAAATAYVNRVSPETWHDLTDALAELRRARGEK